MAFDIFYDPKMISTEEDP